jgi:hypothetical protein
MPIKIHPALFWNQIMKNATLLTALVMFGSYAMAQDTPTLVQPPTTQPTTQPTAEPNVRTESADKLLSKLLRPNNPSAARPLQPIPDGQGIDSGSGRGSVAPNAATLHLLREGTYLVDRVGRLNRTDDGAEAQLTFDSDGKAMQDAPVLILPNLKLMAMENAVTSTNRDLRFRITGVVTEYRGRNYVLLEKVVVVPDATQQF